MVRGSGPDVLLRVRVTPRASANAVGPPRHDALPVRVTAAPADGQANASVCRTVAKALRVGRGSVTVERGERSRDKVLRVAGMSAGDLTRRLDTIPGRSGM